MTHKTKLLGSVQGIVDQAKLLPLGSSSIGKFTTIAELLFISVARKLHFKLYVYIVETLKNKKINKPVELQILITEYAVL